LEQINSQLLVWECIKFTIVETMFKMLLVENT